MPLKDVGAIKTLLQSRAEAAYHCAFIMSQGISVSHIFLLESLDVVFTCNN